MIVQPGLQRARRLSRRVLSSGPVQVHPITETIRVSHASSYLSLIYNDFNPSIAISTKCVGKLIFFATLFSTPLRG